MVRRSRAVLCTVALVVGAVAVPVLVRPAGAAVEAPSTGDGLIAFSVGVQVPPFVEDLYRPSDIWTVRPDGSGLRRLTRVPEGVTAALPAWSPRGGSIVYQTNPNGDHELWAMGAHGAGKHRIAGARGYDYVTPSWSPDGRKIVFSRCDKPFGFVLSCTIATVNADGSGLRILFDGKRIHSRPVFSPDGKTIAFQSDRAGLVSAIWLIDADGSNLRRLTAPATLAYWPDFTPDGKSILYADNCCLPHSNVYAVPVGGGPARRLTNAPGLEDEAFASSSPSGRSLVLWSTAATPGRCCALVVQRANGSRTTVFSGVDDVIVADWGSAPLGREPASASPADVTPPEAAASPTAPPKRRAASPAAAASAPATPPAADRASPGRIVFFDFIARQLFAVRGDGGVPVQISHTDSNHEATQPDLSPDGRHIVFTVFTLDGSAPARTWIMDADGSNAHPLAAEPGYEHAGNEFTPDGRRLVFARCDPEVCSIWSSDLEGRNRREITPTRFSPTEEAIDFFPTVSPDGRHVAFTRFAWRGITARVFVVDIDGGNERPITPAWLEAARPTYSPGGGKLAVNDWINHFGSNIWSLRPDGSSLRQLTTTPYPGNDFFPAWSPDGTRIAFQSDRRYTDNCCVDLFAMRTDGLQEHQVPTGARRGIADLDWGLSPPTAPSGPSAARDGAGGSGAGSCAPARPNRGLPACSPVPDAFAAAGPAAKGRRSG